MELGGHRAGLGNEIIQFEVQEIGWEDKVEKWVEDCSESVNVNYKGLNFGECALEKQERIFEPGL